MRNPLQRLYRTKLAFLATVFTLVGILLMIAAPAVDHSTLAWLRALPLKDFGSALFTTGLIAVFFEYISGEDADARAMERLKAVLADQAPAMRDAVIEGFAFDSADLARVSSPGTLDAVVRNSLAIQLGDRELASDVYDDVREQVIRAQERWHDVDVSVALSHWDSSPGDARTAPLFIATVRWEYTVVPSSPTMRFACASDMAEYRDLAKDPSITSAWYFEPTGDLDGASPEVFELVQLSVNGQDRPIRRTARKGSQVYTVSLGKAVEEATEPVTVSYTYRTLVKQHGHLLYIDIGKPTKGLKVELRYGDCGVRYVNVLDFIASAQQTRLSRTPESVPEPVVAVGFDGWVFPRSGVAFVWVLDGEIGIGSAPASPKLDRQAKVLSEK